MLKISEKTVQTCLSFVVGTDGDPQLLMGCLQSVVDVCGGQYPFEIVVVDNASSDETALVLAEIADEVKVVRFDVRRSWDGALTDGVGATVNGYVMMLSSDVVLESGCVERLVKAMNDDPSCGAISPTVVFGAHKTVSQPPSSGTGVALLLRISTLASGGITEAKHVSSAQVHLQPTNATAPRALSQPATNPAPATPARAAVSSTEVRLVLSSTASTGDGWVSVDADGSYFAGLASGSQRPLPYETASADFIFSEQLLERLPLEQGIFLLSEFRRVLKPGGVVRIAVPDLFATVVTYLKSWQSADWVADRPEIDSAAGMMNARLRDTQVQYFYDQEDLALRLRGIGFTEFHAALWGQSAYGALRGCETASDSQLIIEAVR